MDLSKYEQNCRVCLKAHNAYKNIFCHIVEGYQESVVEILFSLFNVELSPHKAYPQFICRKCLTELENILLFKEDLVRNQKFLFGLFRAAHPDCVEKSDQDHLNKVNTQNAILKCDDFDENLVLKTESISISEDDNTAEQNVEIACKDCDKTDHINGPLRNRSSIYSIEPVQKDNVNVEINKENAKKHYKTEHIKTDENRNISIEKDIDDVNIVAIPITSTQDSHLETAIPQVSFLQKLDLITLEDAKNLKIQPKPLLRARRRCVSRKSKLPRVVSTLVGNVQTRMVQSTSRKKQLDDMGSTHRLINRSVNFLSRYGCRKLNKNYLKQFKHILKADTVSAVPKRDKNLNKQVSRKEKMSSGADESKAVSKHKGCEHVNILQNNKSSEKQSTSSKLNLHVNNIRDYKRTDSLKDINCDKCPMEQSNNNKQNKITHSRRHLEPSPKTEKSVSNIIKNADCLVKSETPSSTELVKHESPGEYRPIPPKNFYQSNKTAEEQSISDENFNNMCCMTSIKTDSSSVKTEKPDFNATGPWTMDFKMEIKEDILPIDDSRALIQNNAQGSDPENLDNTIIKVNSEPPTFISSGDVSQIQSSKSLHKVNTSELPGEQPISLMNSVSNIELNLRSKRNRYRPKCLKENTSLLGSCNFEGTDSNIDMKTSPNSSEASPTSRRQRVLSKKLETITRETRSNTTKVLNIIKNVDVKDISCDIYNNNPQEIVRAEVHNYCLRSKMSRTNIDSENISVEDKNIIRQKLEMDKTTTCTDVFNKRSCERTILQRASRGLICQESRWPEIKTEPSDSVDEMSELGRSHLLNQQSCEKTNFQRASRGLIRQKPKLPEIKTEYSYSADETPEQSCETTVPNLSNKHRAHKELIHLKSKMPEIKTELPANADEIPKFNRSHNENRTSLFSIESVFQKPRNSACLRTERGDDISSENFNILKCQAQDTQSSQTFRKTDIPVINVYNKISHRKLFMANIRKINISEDDELHLTLIGTGLKQKETSENMNGSELDTYPKICSKVHIESKGTENSPNSHELMKDKSNLPKRSKSCTDLPCQSIDRESKSLKSVSFSKRKTRPPVRYSPIPYKKPRVYYCEGHIKKLYSFGNEKL